MKSRSRHLARKRLTRRDWAKGPPSPDLQSFGSEPQTPGISNTGLILTTMAVPPNHPFAALAEVYPADLNGSAFIGFDEDLRIRRELDGSSGHRASRSPW